MALVHGRAGLCHLHPGHFQAPDQFLIGRRGQICHYAFRDHGTDVVKLGQFFRLRLQQFTHLTVLHRQDAAAFGAHVADAQGE